MMDNLFLTAFVLWPGVILVAALLNMLVWWSFSWSELVIDYLIGMVIGLCFFYGTADDATALNHFLLTLSQGLFGLLKWVGVSALDDRQTLFVISAACTGGATLLTAALDHAALAVGRRMSVGGGILSFFIFLFKAPFAILTSAVGLLIGLIGVIVGTINKKGGFGFLGGVFYFEWGLSHTHATTFGWIVNVFRGRMADVIDHELYHTRQFIYLHDWLGIFYFTVAGVWGLISSAVSSLPFDARYFFVAHPAKEIGNPIESVPYKRFP